MSDLIDRQAAIDELSERQRKLIYCFGFENDVVKIMEIAKSRNTDTKNLRFFVTGRIIYSMIAMLYILKSYTPLSAQSPRSRLR